MRAKQKSASPPVASCDDDAMPTRFANRSGAHAIENHNAIDSEICKKIREFFGVSAACYWMAVSTDELLCTEADGPMSEGVVGATLGAKEASVFAEAIASRRAVWGKLGDFSRRRLGAHDPAPCIALAAPVIAAGDGHRVLPL